MKSTTKQDLGRTIYTALQQAFVSDTPMSYSSLLKELGEDPEKMTSDYAGEILVGLLFAAGVAIQGTYEEPVGEPAFQSALNEYVAHGMQGGLSKQQVAELKSRAVARMQEYDACLKDESGGGPASNLGTAFLRHVVGDKKTDDGATVAAARYLFAHINGVKGILAEHTVQ